MAQSQKNKLAGGDTTVFWCSVRAMNPATHRLPKRALEEEDIATILEAHEKGTLFKCVRDDGSVTVLRSSVLEVTIAQEGFCSVDHSEMRDFV